MVPVVNPYLCQHSTGAATDYINRTRMYIAKGDISGKKEFDAMYFSSFDEESGKIRKTSESSTFNNIVNVKMFILLRCQIQKHTVVRSQ